MPDSRKPTPAPLDTLWQAPALVTALLAGEGLALILALAPGGGGDRWVYFGLASLAILWIALLTLGALYLLRHRLRTVRLQKVAWITLGLLLVSTWLTGSGAWLLLRPIWPMAQDVWVSFLLRLSAIVLVVGLAGLVAFQNHWRARQLAVRAKQAELEALHARIRPHFLFNTLNTAAALVHARPDAAEQLLLDLADLFRAALSGPREIALGDELALAQRYLEIESLRFGDRLRILWQVATDLPRILVPALSIQPLVENAIRHGVEVMPGDGDVRVTSRVEDGLLRIEISNPVPKNAKSNSGHGLGQRSARTRIEALTGGLGRLDTKLEDGRYVATVSLPLSLPIAERRAVPREPV